MNIIVDGQLINYSDLGKGDVIVFLHGWGTNLNTFDRLSDHFAKKYRVIRFDFPGFGASQVPKTDWSVDDYAKLTRDLLAKLEIERVHAVIGHSFGGRVIIKAIRMGYIGPERVVLMGAAGVKPKVTLKKSLTKVVAKSGKLITTLPILNRIQPALRKKLYGSIGSQDYLNSGLMKNIFLNVINEDLLPDVSKITQPTLLLWGETDTETPLNDARLMLSRLGSGHLVIIPGAGHFAYMEARDQVVSELDKFL